jgi:hypothetical protein
VSSVPCSDRNNAFGRRFGKNNPWFKGTEASASAPMFHGLHSQSGNRPKGYVSPFGGARSRIGPNSRDICHVSFPDMAWRSFGAIKVLFTLRGVQDERVVKRVLRLTLPSGSGSGIRLQGFALPSGKVSRSGFGPDGIGRLRAIPSGAVLGPHRGRLCTARILPLGASCEGTTLRGNARYGCEGRPRVPFAVISPPGYGAQAFGRTFQTTRLRPRRHRQPPSS